MAVRKFTQGCIKFLGAPLQEKALSKKGLWPPEGIPQCKKECCKWYRWSL